MLKLFTTINKLKLVTKHNHPLWESRCLAFIHVKNDYEIFIQVMNRYTIIGTKNVATPLLEECEDNTHTREMGTWESSETPETSEFDCKGQNASPWSVPYIIGKLSKCKCWKWPCMRHLDICSTSYGKKKGQESNWQFNSQPLKVGNQPDPSVWRWTATHCWPIIYYDIVIWVVKLFRV